MDLATGVDVECTDGPCGRSRYVILDPVDTTITHVVVSDPARVNRAHLVPLRFVTDGSPGHIQLSCSQAELQALPQFSNYDFQGEKGPRPAEAAPEMWLSPVEANWPVAGDEEYQHVKGQLPIGRGARVAATNGHIGTVEEFWVEPGSGRITYLIMGEGHPWGRRHVAVPASEIDRIEDKTVFLKIDKAAVRALPPFHRAYQSDPADKPPVEPDDSQSQMGAGDPSIETLIAGLRSNDWTARENARAALVRIGAPAVSGLAQALKSRERRFRWEAVTTLRQINDPAAAPALLSALEDPGPGIRWIAAEGLAALGRPGVIALLRALVTRPDSPRLGRGARRVLHAVADPGLQQQVTPVLAALKDIEPDLAVPVAAHDALVAMGSNM